MKLWKKLIASLLGLALVMTAMPVVTADVDGDKIMQDGWTIGVPVDQSISFSVYTNSQDTQADDLSVYIDGKPMGTVNIPNDWPPRTQEIGPYLLQHLANAGTDIKNRPGIYDITVELRDGATVIASGDVEVEVYEPAPAGEFPQYPGQIIDDVDYEDKVAPDSSLDLEIKLENDLGTNFNDVTIEAQVYSADYERLGDKVETSEFNLRDGDSKTKTLTIEIPSDAKEEDYQVLIRVDSDEGFLDAYMGDLAVERNEDNLKIDSVIFDSEVKAGDRVDFAVSVLNNGQNDESDVKVKVSIDELELSQTSQAFEVQEDQTAERYFTFVIPKDASADRYTVKVQAWNEEVDVTEADELTVAGKATAPAAQPELSVSADSEVKQITGTGGVFAITVTNGGDADRTLSLSVGGIEGWAESSVNPSTVTIAAGASKLVSVFVAPVQGAAGTHQFSLYVKEGATIVDSLALTAQLAAAKEPSFYGVSEGMVLEGLRWIVAILIVAAIVLFVMWLWKKEAVRGSKKGDAEVYY